jgi:hypothetical protein
MVANYIHFSQDDEQTTIQVIDYFLVNYVGWYRHFTVTDTSTDRDYVWISDGEPDRAGNTNPRIIRLKSSGASNEIQFIAYETFTDASTFTGEITNTTNFVIPIVTLNNCWVVADKERVLVGIGIGEDSSFAPAYFGRLDSLFDPIKDPYPNAVRGTAFNTYDWNESTTNIDWYCIGPAGGERQYFLSTATTMASINRHARNNEYIAFQQFLYTNTTPGQYEIRGYPRGAYQVSDDLSHQTFITLASGVHMVFKGHQAGSNTDNSAWAFGPLKDPRIADPYEMPGPYPVVDYKYRGFVLEEGVFALWRAANLESGVLQDDTGMHKVVAVSGTSFVISPMGGAINLNGTTTFFTGKAPIAAEVLTGDWTTEISFNPDTIPSVSGTLIECGSVGTAPANNTLLGIALISGSNVSVYWDSSPTNRITVTISGGYVDTARWNYLAVVKDTYLDLPRVSLWHAGFGDHKPVFYGSTSVPTTCSGGSLAQWYIGKKPESNSYYDGKIEEIRISDRAKNPSELTASFRRVRL